MHGKFNPIKMKSIRPVLFIALNFFLLALLFISNVETQAAGSQGYRLIGTIQSPAFIGAVIIDPKGEQSFFRIRDKLPDGSEIVEVRSDSILLKGADGSRYEMFIAHDMTHETGAVASVKPERPADPYAPGAMINSTTEQPVPRRPGRSRSPHEEQ